MQLFKKKKKKKNKENTTTIIEEEFSSPLYGIRGRIIWWKKEVGQSRWIIQEPEVDGTQGEGGDHQPQAAQDPRCLPPPWALEKDTSKNFLLRTLDLEWAREESANRIWKETIRKTNQKKQAQSSRRRKRRQMNVGDQKLPEGSCPDTRV